MFATRSCSLYLFAFFSSGLAFNSYAQVSASFANTKSITSTATGTRFEAFGGRPVENIVMSLDEEHGWVVDYEDAPYEVSSSFEDTAVGAYRLDHGGRGWLSLKSRPFSFESQYRLYDNMELAGAVLGQLVERYNSGGNPDTLKVIRERPDRFSVVGTDGADVFGAMVSRKPVLDVPIKLPPGRQTLLDAVTSLAEQLTRESRSSVGVGIVPFSLLNNSTYTPTTDTRPAREQLADILNASPIKLAWLLLYDRNVNSYGLSIVGVKHYVRDNHGDDILEPVANK